MGPEWGKRRAVLVGFLYLNEILKLFHLLWVDVCTLITVFAQIQDCDTDSG